MNLKLLKNRPSDIDEEGFKKLWDNSSYTLEALRKTIKDLVPSDNVKSNDFDTPNHYAKMVWQQAQKDIVEKILELFPESK